MNLRNSGPKFLANVYRAGGTWRAPRVQLKLALIFNVQVRRKYILRADTSKGQFYTSNWLLYAAANRQITCFLDQGNNG